MLPFIGFAILLEEGSRSSFRIRPTSGRTVNLQAQTLVVPSMTDVTNQQKMFGQHCHSVVLNMIGVHLCLDCVQSGGGASSSALSKLMMLFSVKSPGSVRCSPY